MSKLLHSHSPFRIFAVSGLLTTSAIVAVYYYLGWQAALVVMALIVVEVTFSFDNAIINARILSTMSKFWQKMFMTVGILIAVFGMRIIFPIAVVALTAGLPWDQVVQLALNEPDKYSHELEKAHPSISSFGGMFLLMLCLSFFFNPLRKIRWISVIERPLQHIGKWWIYTSICFATLIIISLLPFNYHPHETFIAGLVGILSYLAIHGLTELFTDKEEEFENSNKIKQKVGLAGLTAFMYLEILDASFSFDGVIGAFAITKDVVLIAVGLGIGAFWVRSLTLFMVRRKTLSAYRYLEHGAHYTIGVLALMLIVGLFYYIPAAITGLVGILIVSASVVSSIRAAKAEKVVMS